MDISEYQQSIQNFAFYPRSLGPYYTTMGAMSTLGDLAEILRKSLKENNGSIASEDKTQISFAIGRILFYLSCTASDLNLSLSDICAANIRINALKKEKEILGR